MAFAFLHLGVKFMCLKDLGSYVSLFSQQCPGHLRLRGALWAESRSLEQMNLCGLSISGKNRPSVMKEGSHTRGCQGKDSPGLGSPGGGIRRGCRPHTCTKDRIVSPVRH